MAEIKKMTKKDYFNVIKELVIDRQDLVDFIDHEIELLNKKSSKTSPTKTQIENEKIKSVIVETLTNIGDYATITDIQGANETLANLSNQKVSALLTQLVNDKIVVRMVDKKKAYFKASV